MLPTAFLLNQLLDVFIMVYGAIVHDDHAAWCWIWVELWSLHSMSASSSGLKAPQILYTRFSLKNCMNFSLFTDPSKISNVMMPSTVRAGKIEYR